MSARRRTATHTVHHVVILGAGYAGMAAAVQLTARTGRHPGMRVTVVNAHATFTERMRLHTAATGRRLAELSVPDLLDGTGAQFVRGWVTAVDADARTVRIDDERELRYDTLVYALGAVADTASVPGAADHAYTLDGSQDAALLADRLSRLDCGTVAVVGTGLTGVESAAEIAERYPELRVVLLGSREPGADLNRKAAAHVRATLGPAGCRGARGRRGDQGAARRGGAGGRGGRHGRRRAVDGRDTGVTARVGGRPGGRRTRTDRHRRAAALGVAPGGVRGRRRGGRPPGLRCDARHLPERDADGVHAALCIDRVLRGKQPKPFRFGYYHTPVSLGRGDAVVQFTRPDGSPRRICLTGRTAVRYKETVTASPWPTYGRMRKMPASGAFWPAAAGTPATGRADEHARRRPRPAGLRGAPAAAVLRRLPPARQRGRRGGRGAGRLAQVVRRGPLPGDRPEGVPDADRVQRGAGTAAFRPAQAGAVRRSVAAGADPDRVGHGRRRGGRRVGVDGAAGGPGDAQPAGAGGVRPAGGVRLRARRDRRGRRAVGDGGAAGRAPGPRACAGPPPPLHRGPVTAARGHRAVPRRHGRRGRQRADGAALAGRHPVDRRRRQGPPGAASGGGRGAGRRLVRGPRHRHLPGRRADGRAGRTRRGERRSGRGVPRAGPGDRHAHLRLRRRRPDHGPAQRGQPGQAPGGRRGAAHDMGTR